MALTAAVAGGTGSAWVVAMTAAAGGGASSSAVDAPFVLLFFVFFLELTEPRECVEDPEADDNPFACLSFLPKILRNMIVCKES